MNENTNGLRAAFEALLDEFETIRTAHWWHWTEREQAQSGQTIFNAKIALAAQPEAAVQSDAPRWQELAIQCLKDALKDVEAIGVELPRHGIDVLGYFINRLNARQAEPVAWLEDLIEMAQEHADHFSAAYAGYKPERHAHHAAVLKQARTAMGTDGSEKE